MTTSLEKLRQQIREFDNQNWRHEGLCKTGPDINPGAFFITGKSKIATWCRRLCISCPVRMKCLTYGWHEDYGTWGGLGPEERFTLKKKIADNPQDPNVASFLLIGFDEKILKRFDKWGWSIPELQQKLAEVEPPE